MEGDFRSFLVQHARNLNVLLQLSMANILPQKIELLPGNPGKPLFENEEARRRFEERWAKSVEEALKDLPQPVRFWPFHW